MTVKPPNSKIVCPHCSKPDTWQQDNAYRPFCSERCKLIDLGDWASEKNRLPGEPAQPNDEDPRED